ncbi:MAG: alpha-hydroxy-acid oxidizing protein [Alphaproteobacteria bacterium]|nr:alpha-hydroxy-acid oxidizing protein [Alphaproteobacteria bacterium]
MENQKYNAPTNVNPIEIIDVNELEARASMVIPRGGFDYIAGGAESEKTLQRNVSAFDDLDIVPRVLRGVDKPDLKTSVLGIDISLPVIIAPAAAHGLAHISAEAGTARGAAVVDTIMAISNYASSSLRDIAVAGGGAPQWFQLYLSKDDAFNRQIVRLAESLGMRAIVLTVDAPVGGNRFRDAKNDFKFPLALPNVAKKSGDTKGQGIGAIFAAAQNRFASDTVRYVKSFTRLPVIVKGIQHPDDADAAIAAGADAVWVSNHGGRQLDGAPASIEVLPEIAARVNKRVPIIFDSGIRNGTHIFKAIAAGADVVAIGRPVIYALSLGGWMGVVSLFDYLKQDLSRVMTLAGAQTVEDIKNTELRPKCMSVRCTEL